jgi:hypothetical protein
MDAKLQTYRPQICLVLCCQRVWDCRDVILPGKVAMHLRMLFLDPQVSQGLGGHGPLLALLPGHTSIWPSDCLTWSRISIDRHCSSLVGTVSVTLMYWHVTGTTSRGRVTRVLVCSCTGRSAANAISRAAYRHTSCFGTVET